MDDYFFIGYTGNKHLKESDFAKYSLQELKNMVKSQAKRLNTRLSSLEKNKMTGGHAYQKARRFVWDELRFMRPDDAQKIEDITPRFETAVTIRDAEGRKIADRTRADLIEQLIQMGDWESLTTSTVSGMMETFGAQYEAKKNKGVFTGTFEEYVEMATTDAYAVIAKYYGSSTADEIISAYGEDAANAFVQAHPEFFQKNNVLNGEGGLLEGEMAKWYRENWENVKGTVESDEDLINNFEY